MAIYESIKKSKTASAKPITKLDVSGTVYHNVSDGFHKSLSFLKAPDMSTIESSPSFQQTVRDFNHIMKIVQNGEKIPTIKVHESIEILYSVRRNVNDLHSITAAHFINGGSTGLRHFHHLLSALIENVNNSSLSELNDIWAMILYKGHNKNKESARSYRTISTCPLLAKCLDIYVGRRYYSCWQNVQAPTQFQGEASSHELASLLLTETIQHSLYLYKKPIFVLLLDAKSAFDVVLRQNAIVNAYLAGTQDQGLIYLNNRLEYRRTFPQWSTTLMGPIQDKRGLEQGAVNSDRLYKLGNNAQLKEAQESGLGIDLYGSNVASIGQADDCALVSDSLVKLACLLYLTNLHCTREHVELVPEKTKLLVWSPSSQRFKTNLFELGCPISIDGKAISFADSADHVGVRRSVEGGNMPHVIDRIAAHKRALAAILGSGAARHHNARPSASIHLEKVYASPVLFSGMASLVLNEKEINTLARHHKESLRKLQKLPPNTPECVVYFLAGCLPATGILHLRMLGLLGMISRSKSSSILQQIGRGALLSIPCNKKSWFTKMRSICQIYNLKDPLLVLQDPPSKETWKGRCKSAVISFWEQKLRSQAALLPSLAYFRPEFMSLTKAHPIWNMTENDYEVKKATTVCEMLSGRYNTDYHVRYWSRLNPSGLCQLCLAANHARESLDQTNSEFNVPLGTLEHLLLVCPQLQETRDTCKQLWISHTEDKPQIRDIFLPTATPFNLSLWSPKMELLLDPTSCPNVIDASQKYGIGILSSILYLSRTWCYSHHVRRRKHLKLLNII